jgi:hypothetical protein
MDHKTVEELEGKIEEPIAETVVRMGLKKHPFQHGKPSKTRAF